MPKLVYMEVNPDFKPQSEDEKRLYAEVKKKGPPKRQVPYVTAVENIRHTRQMLQIQVDDPRTDVKVAIALEDMPTEQLKMMMLTAGVKPTKKQMSRDEIITSIRTKLAALEVTDSEE